MPNSVVNVYYAGKLLHHPVGLDAIEEIYKSRTFSREEFNEVALSVNSEASLFRPKTTDVYTWYWAFRLKNGAVIFFPWREVKDFTVLHRPLAIVGEVEEGDLEAILLKMKEIAHRPK